MRIGLSRRSGIVALFFSAILSAGCSESGDETVAPSGVDAGVEMDSSTKDSTADSSSDSAAEASPDTAVDTAFDTFSDSATDSPNEADSSLDTGSSDTGNDVTTDVTQDSSADSSMDTSSDSVIDSPSDSKAPFSHCLAPVPIPSWAELAVKGHDLVVRSASVDLYLSALDQGLMRLVYAGKGEEPSHRSWAVKAYTKDFQAFVSGTAGGVQICGPELGIEVDAQARLRVWDKNGVSVVEDGSSGGYTKGIEDIDGVATSRIGVLRASPTDELFYGFGERTGPLERRGQRMTFWNTDGYQSAYGGYAPDADPMYQSIPFYMGMRQSKAYGVFTDNSYRMRIDAAKTDPSHIAIDSFGGVLDQFIIPGPSMREVIQRYTQLTGRHPMPPRWSLGFHQSRWGYWDASTFEQTAQGFRDRKIPMDTMWLDIQHMDGFRTFTWNPTSFPDPAAMIARLGAKGIKVVAIEDPALKQDPGWSVYDSGLAAGHFLKKANQEVFTAKVWPGVSVFPDFSSPAARDWWGDQLGKPMAMGLSGVWLDVNEPTIFPESGGGSVPNDLVVAGEGTATTMGELHNVYGLKEAQATHAGMLKASPGHRPFVLSRAGYSGIQNYAAVWTGDAPSSWTSLRQVFPMLLNLGLSGVGFVGSDVGGYSGNASSDLFARWMAIGSFSPFFRSHVTSGVPGQEPWMFGTEVEDISRAAIQDRYELLPYLYSLFAQSSVSGDPILRPMVYEFQQDPSTVKIDDQAMFGPFMLVAPAMVKDATTRSVYLPKGRWFEAKSGAIYEGPSTIDVGLTLAALPTFVREGAIIPRGPTMQWSDEKPLDPLFLDVYPSEQASSFAYYEDEGDGYGYQQSAFSKIVYSAQKDASGSTLRASKRIGSWVPSARKIRLRVRRVDHAPTSVTWGGVALVSSGTLAALETAGQGYFYDDNDRSIVVMHGDGDDFEVRMNYDTSVTEPRPAVKVQFVVHVPVGTPLSTKISVASSASGWVHEPLEWSTEPNTARGFIAVPRGEWFQYKISRGSWDTVEKWANCAEASNRYGFGATGKAREETVATWRDWCP